MSCTSNVLLSPNGCVLASPKPLGRFLSAKSAGRKLSVSVVRASSDDPDCNAEECAPDKEVGTVSMEWLAGEKTKVVGTFPPRKKRGWTGYVEKDTAGQTNVYSIEPAVYVAESAISSGTAGSSSDGAENTAAIVAGVALIAVAAASSILLQVGKDAPARPKPVDYSGPSLSYYINKFKPSETVQASSFPALTEAPPVAQQETTLPETSPAVEAQPEASSVPTSSTTS
uniref:Protein MAINTENANCE OF PSII UNDER HIGH LIGHT 1 n=1 Tax=Noccaea caerulescens TaxID=107243 RepID=A0A1J3E303_NOCCA